MDETIRQKMIELMQKMQNERHIPQSDPMYPTTSLYFNSKIGMLEKPKNEKTDEKQTEI